MSSEREDCDQEIEIRSVFQPRGPGRRILTVLQLNWLGHAAPKMRFDSVAEKG